MKQENTRQPLSNRHTTPQQNLGITQIYGGEHCTFNEKESFFSYRRDGKTGRMASSDLDKKNKPINTTNRTLKCGLFLAYSG